MIKDYPKYKCRCGHILIYETDLKKPNKMYCYKCKKKSMVKLEQEEKNNEI